MYQIFIYALSIDQISPISNKERIKERNREKKRERAVKFVVVIAVVNN
jgi:hypothetical protein